MKRQLLLALTVAMMSVMAFAQPRSASEPQLLIKSDVGLMAPVWSPTGDKIAVTTTGYTGVFVADADGSDLKCITNSAGAGYKMQWNTDGTQIIGRINVTENHRVYHEVKAWNVTNASERTIVGKTRDLKGTPTWKTPLTTTAASNAYDIMVNDPVGAMSKISALQAIGGKMVLNPALSPDGKKVAFQIYAKGMYVCNADGTNVKYIGKGVYPAWLNDNESIVYNTTTDNGSRLTSSTLQSMNVNTGKSVTLVSREGIMPLKPTVSPDGYKVAFENVADEAIYVVTLKF